MTSCDGIANRSGADILQVERSLPGQAGTVALADRGGRVIDRIDYGPQLIDRSIGRVGSAWRLLLTATPGQMEAEAVTLGSERNLMINELHASGTAQDINQMVRWINTKEEHASKIIKLVGEYCLCQRVKKEVFADDKDYVDALKCHHAVMQAAMKSKQSVDTAAADALDHAIGDFGKMYTKE